MSHVTAAFRQQSFRGRNDNGSETTATWKAAINTNFSEAVDDNFRLRFLVQETAGGSENNEAFQIQRRLNGGTWTNINSTSSVVRTFASPNITDAGATTQQLGTGTYITTNDCIDEVDGVTGGFVNFAGNDEVECEFSLQVRGVDVVHNDSIQFRVLVNGALLNTYATTPTLTVLKIVAPTVTTSAATSITTNSAQGNGNVTSAGNGTITERGFVWVAGAGTPTTANSKVIVAGTTGVFSGSMTGLSTGTTYTYCAYAINSAGTSYGANTNFTTISNTPPTVSLSSPTNAASISDQTPSVSFLGTDAQSDEIDYQVKIFNNTGGAGVGDSFTGGGSRFGGNLIETVQPAVGQSVLGMGETLNSVSMWLSKVGSPTGNITIKVWSTTGTHGTNAVPSTLLATSNALSASVLATWSSYTDASFAFSDDQKFVLEDGVTYALTVHYAGDSTNYVISSRRQDADATHGGNFIWTSDATLATWSSISTYDNIFGLTTTDSSEYLCKTSISGAAGFLNLTNGADTRPFTSGNTVQYTVQAADALPYDTYNWQVRGGDASGSGVYGAYSTARTFVLENNSPTVVRNYTDISVDVYNFDGSGGISDPGSAFTNDANAFDGSTATHASSFTDNQYLIGIGTNAPSIASGVISVRARFYIRHASVFPDIIIKTNGGEILHDDTASSLAGAGTAGYSSWVTLTVPTGGWSWSTIQSLQVEASKFGEFSFLEWYTSEIEVTHSPQAPGIYHFDASDNGPTDPDGSWSSLSFAFNGSIADGANTDGSGGNGNNTFRELSAGGTNAPSTGGGISSVRVRVYAGSGTNSSFALGEAAAEVWTDGGVASGEQLGIITFTQSLGYTGFVTLAVPTGGWTWAKIQALEAIFYSNHDNGLSGPNIRKLEIEVSSVLIATPTLGFTGTDAEGDNVRYQVQIAEGFDEIIGDSYALSNADGTEFVQDISFGQDKGQTFIFENDSIIESMDFDFNNNTSLSAGTLRIRIFATTGASGSKLPTGSVLAVSDTINIADIGTTKETVTFVFSGVNRITLDAGVEYAASIESTNPNGAVNVYSVSTSPSHQGNAFAFNINEDVWELYTHDLVFVFRVTPAPLVNAVSGTDTGFANTVTPADTDPFNSGEKADYDVQTALAAGVYNWRVRGIDPTGSNTYGAWSDVGVFEVADVSAVTETVTESLKYTVETTPPAVTRSAEYQVSRFDAATKPLVYSVVTTPADKTKGTEYQVIKTIGVSHDAKYVVVTTPDAVTRTAEYRIGKTRTDTRDTEYQVVDTDSVTKNTNYEVITTPAPVTKSLEYVAIVTTSEIETRDVSYTVVTVTPVTHDLSYQVVYIDAATKSLAYFVVNERDTQNRDVIYKVSVPTTPKTRDLTYAVVSPAPDETKEIVYTIVATAPDETRDITYSVVTTAPDVTRDTEYQVVDFDSKTKSAKYSVISSDTKTRDVAYEMIVTGTESETRGLAYAVVTVATPITRDLEYQVVDFDAETKSTKYTVITTAPDVTRDVSYRIVVTSDPISKASQYTVTTTPADKTKDVEYRVIDTPPNTTKSLAYVVVTTPEDTVRDTQYRVVEIKTETRDITYDVTVTGSETTTRDITYTVATTPADITRGLGYEVLTFDANTKTLVYSVISVDKTVTKETDYFVAIPTTPETRDIKYTVTTSATPVTRNLAYQVVDTGTPQKQIVYTVIKTKTETRNTDYAIAVPVTPETRDLTYAIAAPTPDVTKDTVYTVITVDSKTRDITYDVLVTGEATETRDVTYAVIITPADTTRDIEYQVVSDDAATKGLNYEIITTAPDKTRDLDYFIGETKDETRDIAYSVSLATPDQTLGVDYFVEKERSQTNDLTYSIEDTKTKTRDLVYILAIGDDVIKNLAYTVATTPTDVTRDTEYRIDLGESVEQREIKYSVTSDNSRTRDVDYSVLQTDSSTKSTKYTVIKDISDTRELGYKITGAAISVTREVVYSINLGETAETRNLRYTVVTTPSVSAFAEILQQVGSLGDASQHTTITLPSNLTVGNTLLVIFSDFNTSQFNIPADWTYLGLVSSAYKKLAFAAKVVDGTEGASIQISNNTTNTYESAFALEIKGQPDFEWTVESITYDSNPPAHTASYGADKTLWLAIVSAKVQGWTSTFWTAGPVGYSGFQEIGHASGSNLNPLATAWREAEVVTEDPSNFTEFQNLGFNERPIAVTMAISPILAPIQRTVQYTVKASPTPVTRDVAYQVVEVDAATKTLKYEVITTAAPVTRDVAYLVTAQGEDQVRDITYKVVSPAAAITRDTEYQVVDFDSTQKPVVYTVLTDSEKTYDVEYRIVLEETETRDVQYSIEREGTEVRPTVYAVTTEVPEITHSVTYAIEQIESATKALKYVVATAKTNPLDLRYDIQTEIYSRGEYSSLPADAAELSTVYSSTEEGTVSTSDDLRVSLDGNGFLLHQFKKFHTNNEDDFTFNWEGQSTVPATTAAVYMQVYNHNSAAWETIDTETTSSLNIDFTMSGTINVENPNYYGANNEVVGRIYQET